MRIPQQVPERVKEAPAQALRAVFSGIGQVLLVADRIKNRGAEPERAQPAAAAPRAPSGSGKAAPGSPTRWRSLDQTGNVRLLSEEDPSESAAKPSAPAGQATEPPAPAGQATEPPAPAGQTAEPPAPAGQATEPPAPAGQTAEPPAPAEPGPAAGPSASAEQAALPVPNYDDLTVASLRARLRNLDQSQVQALLDYEKAHAGRADVLTMFERRIAKLESNGA